MLILTREKGRQEELRGWRNFMKEEAGPIRCVRSRHARHRVMDALATRLQRRKTSSPRQRPPLSSESPRSFAIAATRGNRVRTCPSPAGLIGSSRSHPPFLLHALHSMDIRVHRLTACSACVFVCAPPACVCLPLRACLARVRVSVWCARA